MIATLNANAYHIPLANETAQCCITSPPFFGLRSYLDGNDPLKHLEIGSESTPELYIEHLVAVFREVKRVLRSDGVALLNLGNCYQDKQLQCIPHRVALALQANGWYLRSAIPWIKKNCMPESITDRPTTAHEYWFLLAKSRKYYWDAETIKKDALTSKWPGIGPARLKVRSRGEKYEPMATRTGRNYRTSDMFLDSLDIIVDGQRQYLAHLEHIRDTGGFLLDEESNPLALVVNTQKYGGGHFAAFPEKLVKPLILASTSARGACPECGATWQRVTERGIVLNTKRPQARRALEIYNDSKLTDEHIRALRAVGTQDAGKSLVTQTGAGKNRPEIQRMASEAKRVLKGYYREFLTVSKNTTGWQPSCTCNAGDPVPCLVLDPFAGTSTVGRVCIQHHRSFVGLELNHAYTALARERTSNVQMRLKV